MQAKAPETRQTYQQKVEAQLDKLDVQIARLRLKVAQAKVNAKTKHYDKVDALTRKQHQTQIWLQMLKSADEETWQEFKVGVESALHELQDAFNNALAQYKQSNL